MKSELAREFEHNNVEFATLFDELLSAEKELNHYPSPQDWIQTHGFYPRDPGELTYLHLSRGHFTEAVEALAGIFGPCRYSREACFLQAGFYPGQGPDMEAMRAQLFRVRRELRSRAETQE